MGPRGKLICGQVFIDIGLTIERLTNEHIRQRTGSAGKRFRGRGMLAPQQDRQDRRMTRREEKQAAEHDRSIIA